MPGKSYYDRIAADILRDQYQTNGLSTGALSNIFEIQPAPLDRFLTDQYYGISIGLSGIQQEFIKHFEMIYNIDTYIAMVEEWGKEWAPPRLVNELVAEWGKGSGKDMITRVGFTRVTDLLLSLRSPQKYFGIPETDVIHMLNVAASAPQAHRAFYRPLRNLLVSSPRFKDEFLMPPSDLASSMKFTKGIELISGHSEAETLEGLNLIAACADEISAFKTVAELRGTSGKTSNRTADYILDMLRSSSRTRFPENFKLSIISYPRRQDDAIMQAMGRARMDINRNGEDSRSFASGPYATWEVNPRVTRASFQPDYDTDPEMARAKYECDPPLATDRFLRNDHALNAAFSVERIVAPIEVTYYWGLPESVDVNLLNEKPIEGWQVHFTFAPDLVPMDGAVYSLHGDMATRGDAAGIAMAHVKQYQRLIHPDDDMNFSDIEEMRPIMGVDFVFGFEAALNAKDPEGKDAPREVELRWYRQLIWELMKRGFIIGSVTFDGWQSVDMIQILKMYGVNAAKLSLDRTDKVYQSFKEALYSGRVVGYQHTKLVEEFRKLMHTGHKVDHPPGGSKDLADSVAGAVYGAAVIVSGEGEDPISRYHSEPFSMAIPLSQASGRFGGGDMASLGFGGNLSGSLGFG